ncbi:hypothetical protein [Rufibacter sp. XAAS-G3-1]|uniref:hypothetical protein n=1 Tax=Rufibacter sp. XAAS-G3-1 TaxID=2729134 RepID=UPI0015E7B831|nr:hypothetical protein [Rufibacter sp. XAAS-G3-1]
MERSTAELCQGVSIAQVVEFNPQAPIWLSNRVFPQTGQKTNQWFKRMFTFHLCNLKFKRALNGQFCLEPLFQKTASKQPPLLCRPFPKTCYLY